MSEKGRADTPLPVPRPPLYTPSALSLYRDCNQRYFLARRIRHPAVEDFSPALERGKAVHAVLAQCAAALRAGRPVPDGLAARVERALPHDGYPALAAWEEDAGIVLAQVGAGIAYLRRGDRILAIEQFYRWTYPGDALTPRFTLGAIADLVTANVDDEGHEYVTVTDWKSSTRKSIDLLQEVALRIVVRHALGARYRYLVSTTAHLGDGSWSAIVRDTAACREVWREVKGLVTATESDRLWVANPSGRCNWCQFFGNGCVLDRPLSTDEDDTMRWLEGREGGRGG